MSKYEFEITELAIIIDLVTRELVEVDRALKAMGLRGAEYWSEKLYARKLELTVLRAKAERQLGARSGDHTDELFTGAIGNIHGGGDPQ